VTSRTVLTTGGNGGIGLATALEVAKRGHQSIVTVRSAAAREVVARAAREVVARAARERAVAIEALELDVTDARACADVIDRVRPDVLVNNAGYALFGAVETTTEDDAKALFDTLLFASVRLARLSLPHMRRRGWGRVLFMSSLFGRVAAPPLGWYAAAKHAIEGIADVLRMEVARDGIQVVVIEPGGVRSPMLEKAERESRRKEANRYAESLRTAAERLQQTDMFRADPALVGRAVVEAIEARNPPPRMLVGYDAQIIGRLFPVVPTWLSDRVTRLVQGL